MRIDLPGKYIARDGKTVEILRIDRTTANGRHPDDTQTQVWDINTGEAIGHDLSHSISGRHFNLPEIAQNIAKTLGNLDTEGQRMQVLAIVRNQICFDCGAVIEPGLPCPCTQRKHVKSSRKTSKPAVQ